MLMLAPVVIFVYNRPEHTQRTLEALAQNYLADKTQVYIYSDGAKNEDGVEKVNLVREYIDTLIERNLFQSVKIIKAESNKGLANSVINGVSEVIEKYGKAIVVEDDIVTSPDFLQYMNDALDYYQNNNKIWSISGYTFNVDIPEDYQSEVYLSYRGCSWGWATWKDRWEKVDWNVCDYNQFKVNKKLRDKFNRGGRDLTYLLDLQMHGIIDSWAIRCVYSQWKHDMLTVYPVVSRIKNIGFDGTGVHCVITSKYDTTLNNSYQKCRFDNSKLDNRILESFKAKI